MSNTIQLTQPTHQFLSGKHNASFATFQLPQLQKINAGSINFTQQSSVGVSATSGVCVTSGTTFSVFSSNAVVASLSSIQKIPSVYFIALDHIDIGEKILSFNQSIFARVTNNENGFVCQNEELGIITMAVDLENCIKDFKDEILFVLNEYGKEEDSKLTSDAKELKRKILAYVRQ